MKRYIVDFENGNERELLVEWTDEVRLNNGIVTVNGEIWYYNVRWLYVV